MSVIFGIDEPNQIVICGDKRASTKEGQYISDELQKVTTVNKHLAFVSAGNAAIEKALQIDISKSDIVDKLTVDDIVSIIETFYKRVIETAARTILMLPFCCLIAGKTNNEESALVSLSCMNGKFTYQKVPMALYPPANTKIDECNNAFVRNYKLHHDLFCELTVRDVAKISSLVSPTGTKWVYNKITGIGTQTEF